MILPVRPRDVLRDKGYFGYCACGEPMRFSIDTPARERVYVCRGCRRGEDGSCIATAHDGTCCEDDDGIRGGCGRSDDDTRDSGMVVGVLIVIVTGLIGWGLLGHGIGWW